MPPKPPKKINSVSTQHRVFIVQFKDVMSVEQAIIAEQAGACAVMVLEK